MYGTPTGRGREPPRSSRHANVSRSSCAPVAAAIRAASSSPGPRVATPPSSSAPPPARSAAAAASTAPSETGGAGRTATGAAGPRLAPARVGGKDQRRDAPGARLRDRERRVRGRRPRVLHRPHPVRDRPHDRLDVAGQRRAQRLVTDRVIADDVDHRRARLVRVVDVRERVPEPRPEVQQRRGRDVRHPRVAVRRTRRHALEQRQHPAHLRHAVHRRHQVHLRRPRVREADVHARADQRPQDALRAVQTAPIPNHGPECTLRECPTTRSPRCARPTPTASATRRSSAPPPARAG